MSEHDRLRDFCVMSCGLGCGSDDEAEEKEDTSLDKPKHNFEHNSVNYLQHYSS